MKTFDITKIKTKEQLEQFVDGIITGEVNLRSTTKHDEERLKWCLLHLQNRDKISPKNPKVICDLLRVLYNFCEDDKVLQQLILIITSMASRMTVKLNNYKHNKK
jgi:hypothetical protein